MRGPFEALRARPEIACVVVALLLHALRWNYTVDDAYISFRYAENLIAGSGLVYNPSERVEGYTNFLWVLLVAPAMAAGLSPVVASKILGLLASAALVVLVARDVAQRFGRALGCACAALLAADASFSLWTTAGLEMPLFLLFVYLALRTLDTSDATARLSASLGLWGGLAALTRPEGYLAFAAILAAALLRGRRAGLLKGALLFGAVTVPHLVFRVVYYGQLLPNTFFAKTSSEPAWSRGLTYLGDWVIRYGAWPIVLLALLGVARAWRQGNWRRVLPPLALAGAFGAYIAAVGGDGLTMFRFSLFLLLPLVLLAPEGAELAASLAPAARRRALAVTLLGAALFLPLRNSFAGPYHAFAVQDRDRVLLHWVEIGKWLKRHALDGGRESVAVGVAGAIPFYGGVPAIDMLGITEPHIARRAMPAFGSGIAGHEKHDIEYVLSRKPDFFIHYPFLLPSPDSAFAVNQFHTEWNPGLAELLSRPEIKQEFDRTYRGEIAEVRIDGTRRSFLAFFRRRPDVVKAEKMAARSG